MLGTCFGGHLSGRRVFAVTYALRGRSNRGCEGVRKRRRWSGEPVLRTNKKSRSVLGVEEGRQAVRRAEGATNATMLCPAPRTYVGIQVEPTIRWTDSAFGQLSAMFRCESPAVGVGGAHGPSGSVRPSVWCSPASSRSDLSGTARPRTRSPPLRPSVPSSVCSPPARNARLS